MIATERNTNRNFPCQKTMGTKPWENKSYCFSNSAVTKFGEICLKKLYQTDKQFSWGRDSTKKNVIF